ncbi:hypothetical protein ACFSE1_02515 [Rhizobium helianthi]|uniref:Lipoprotein n=1 Tax=Rhizobium helianthi TaxID=1132695 RepID=A0ABW4LZ47_9HYPH
MLTAMVMMTILGCDDGVTDCQYVATLKKRWTTIERCNAVSEKELANFANVSFPVVIAVCQNPAVAETKPAQTAPASEANGSGPPHPEPTEQQILAEERSLGQKAIEHVSSILPSKDSVQNLLHGPIRVIEDGYSWVAKRLR